VQHPDSIDWATLTAHLEWLFDGRDCWTPVLDWKGSGQRLSDGGEVAHPKSRLIKGGARSYVIPGCFAFAAPIEGRRVFIETPLEVIAARWFGKPVVDAERALRGEMGDGFDRILAQRAAADSVLSGAG
jgi:hypothetical protein